MQLDQVTDNRQPQAEPALLPRDRRVGLAEAVKHVRQELRVYADAAVAHTHLDVGVGAPQTDFDPPILRRKLDGVRHQIPDDLL